MLFEIWSLGDLVEGAVEWPFTTRHWWTQSLTCVELNFYNPDKWQCSVISQYMEMFDVLVLQEPIAFEDMRYNTWHLW